MHVPIVPSDPSRDHTTIDHVIMSELKCGVVYRREAQHSKGSNIPSLAAFLMGNGRFAQQAYKNRFWHASRVSSVNEGAGCIPWQNDSRYIFAIFELRLEKIKWRRALRSSAWRDPPRYPWSTMVSTVKQVRVPPSTNTDNYGLHITDTKFPWHLYGNFHRANRG